MGSPASPGQESPRDSVEQIIHDWQARRQRVTIEDLGSNASSLHSSSEESKNSQLSEDSWSFGSWNPEEYLWDAESEYGSDIDDEEFERMFAAHGAYLRF
jgi:hypothetical protein